MCDYCTTTYLPLIAVLPAVEGRHTRGVIVRYETEVRAALTTPSRAHEVRVLRIDREETWRSIGKVLRERWRIDVPEGDAQSLGATLCHVAAEVLGEDPDGPPWN